MKKGIFKLISVTILMLFIGIQIFYNLSPLKKHDEESKVLLKQVKDEKVKQALIQKKGKKFYEIVNKIKSTDDVTITNISNKDENKEISIVISSELANLMKMFDFLKDNDIIVIRYDIQEKDSKVISNILGQYKGEINE